MVVTGARVNLSDPETKLVTTDRGSTFQLSQTLTLDDARDEDSGSYSCQAETADGTKVNQTFELFVRSKINDIVTSIQHMQLLPASLVLLMT